MANKPAPVTDAWPKWTPVTDAEVEKWENRPWRSGQPPSTHEALVHRLILDRARYREALRLWNDHLPGCSGSPRCECGYAEARALLEEVPDA